jgi:hypothetical protein
MFRRRQSKTSTSGASACSCASTSTSRCRRGLGHRRHARPRGAADTALSRRSRCAGDRDEPSRQARRGAGPAYSLRPVRRTCCSGSSAATWCSSTRHRRQPRRRGGRSHGRRRDPHARERPLPPGARKPTTRVRQGELASLGDIYVNDAFGAAHRAHASTAGSRSSCPRTPGSAARTREVKTLSGMLARAGAAVRGDPRRLARSPTSSASSTGCSTSVDTLLIGGGMAFTLPRRQGHRSGRDSIVEDDWVEPAKKMLEKARPSKGVDLVLPTDFVVAGDRSRTPTRASSAARRSRRGMMGLDIGPVLGRALQEARSSAPRRSSGTARWAYSR